MIYCVEDDASIRDIEIYTLRSTGFEAEGFADGASFFEALKITLPELILLDVMLPGMDGVEILTKLRERPQTRFLPVIMATAKGMEYDKVKSLELGADDYLVKPFGMMEMVARVKAVLRRSNHQTPTDETLESGRIRLTPASHRVTVDDMPVELTRKEFEVLHLFMTNPGRVFSREQLLSSIWDSEYSAETRTVDVHMRTLRQKLGAAGERITTVRGVGYRLENEA